MIHSCHAIRTAESPIANLHLPFRGLGFQPRRANTECAGALLMIYTKQEWAAELERRKKWDWTLSDCELGRRHNVFRESIQRLRHQLGHPPFKKEKKPKVYSKHLHCAGLTLKWVDESEGLAKRGPRAGGWRKRFWSKVKKTGLDECWMWTGLTQIGGYGTMMIGTVGKTRRWHMTHRLSFVLHNGSIPQGKIVRHKCDVKCCVNPNHLELGTSYDNVMDAVKRQRVNCGERNGQSKYIASQVLNVRGLFKSGVSQVKIAKALGISVGVVNGITRNKTWRHLL